MMIIRETPQDKTHYIAIEIEKGKNIHKSGIIPIYIDDKFMWFRKRDIKGGE